MFLAMKYGAFTAKVAEAKVPRGFPLGPGVCAVSPHWTMVFSAPAPSMVMKAFIGGILTFSLKTMKLVSCNINGEQNSN